RRSTSGTSRPRSPACWRSSPSSIACTATCTVPRSAGRFWARTGASSITWPPATPSAFDLCLLKRFERHILDNRAENGIRWRRTTAGGLARPAVPRGWSPAMYLTDDQRAVQEMARAFAEREVAPLAAEYERRRCLPPGIVRRMGEQGLIGVMFPEEYGGAGGDVLAQALAVQEISKVNAGIGATLLVQVLALYPIWQHGTEEQKRRYLPAGLRGEIIGAIGMTEPDAGSDFAAVQTRAVRDGDAWVIDGRKTFITNGPVADFVLVAARTVPGAGRKGLSLFIVDRGTPGFSVARKSDKMGWHTSETGELLFEGCRLPAEQLLGREQQGFYYVMEDFNLER